MDSTEKEKRLFRVGLILGLIPLVIGTIIFLFWWVNIEFFAVNIDELQGLGIIWILISIPVALTAIGFLFSFLLKNTRKNSTKFLLGLLSVLFNIPVLIAILYFYFNISGKTYLKIENNTGEHISSIVIEEPNNHNKIGGLDLDEWKVTSIEKYEVTYGEKLQSKQKFAVYLNFKLNGKFIKRELPFIPQGQINKITIEKDLQIRSDRLDYM